MENPLAKLALDHWYQALMVVGFVTFTAAGAGLLKEFPAVPTAVIALGVFFIGLGEWTNHPLQTRVMYDVADRPSGLITGHPRNVRPVGVVFDVLGCGLVVLGAYRLFA